MISAIDSKYSSYISAQSVQSTAKVAEEKAVSIDKEKSVRHDVRVKTDTLEISSQGKEALQAISQNASPISAVSKISSTKATDVTASLTSSVQDTNPVLTGKTESELSELVSDSTITRRQADAELLKRSEAKAQVEPTGNQADNPATENQEAEVSPIYAKVVNAYSQMALSTGTAQQSPATLNIVA